jgi:anti-sigma factor (TIGR02949 family)
MTCDDMRERLSEWVDGELSPDVTVAVAAHLDTCAICRARADSMRALKHAIARLPSRESPPVALRARIDALRFTPPRRVLLAGALTVAALVAFALVTSLYLNGRNRPGASLSADQLVADHLRSIAEPAEIVSDDPHEVARFFAGHLSFAPVVPRLGGSALKGGRLCTLAGRRSELLFYDVNGETVSLFVANRGLAGPGCEASRGHQVCERRTGDVSLLLVGTQPPERLSRLLAEAQ